MVQKENRQENESRGVLAENGRKHHEGSSMIPRPAQYLLRFDDLCPTMHSRRWQRCLPLIEEFGIRPILSVIPDNQETGLNFSPPDPEFWSQMRAMETAGATIALHGYTHLCISQGVSLLPLHHRSEFSGMPEESQREWIREGLEILRGQGLHPKIFVAPRHGFDRTTLHALRKEGLRVISDGFARVPFTRSRITWIPQQLWKPVEKSKGLWTICVHSNYTHGSEVDELRDFLRAHAAQFTSVERVLAEYLPAKLDVKERLHAGLALWRARAARARKRRKSHSHHRRSNS
jgi:predicted deacetylase